MEALPSLVLTPVVLNALSDNPDDASWLSVPERLWLKRQLDLERQSRANTQHGVLDLLRTPAIICLGGAYFGVTGFNYGLSFFLPQIVRQFGLSIVETGFVAAMPFALAAVGMTWWGSRSDRRAERRFHLSLALGLAIIGLAGSTIEGPPAFKLVLLCVAAVGVFSALPVYWTVPPPLLAPATAAPGIALINSLGNLSGFVDPYAVGAIKDLTGSFSGGLQLISIFGVISLLILAVMTPGRATRLAPTLVG
jgi:MFS transporter, ACS family, tartrate transporter